MKKNETKTIIKTEDNSVILPVTMRVHSLGDGGTRLANLSVNLGDAFVMRGLRLMEGKNGPFLNFPSYKGRDGYTDICFPLSAELRQQMTDQAVETYRQALAQHQSQQMETGMEEPQYEQEPVIGMQMG